MSDTTALVLVVVGFASLATVHVAICVSLARRTPRWHGLLAFVVPPCAPVLAARAGAWKSAVLWGVAAVSYAVGLLAARR